MRLLRFLAIYQDFGIPFLVLYPINIPYYARHFCFCSVSLEGLFSHVASLQHIVLSAADRTHIPTLSTRQGRRYRQFSAGLVAAH